MGKLEEYMFSQMKHERIRVIVKQHEAQDVQIDFIQHDTPHGRDKDTDVEINGAFTCVISFDSINDFVKDSEHTILSEVCDKYRI